MLDDMLGNENVYDEDNPSHRLLYRFIEGNTEQAFNRLMYLEMMYTEVLEENRRLKSAAAMSQVKSKYEGVIL